MKANIQSKIWDFVPVAGFFILAATEGKAYPLAGMLTIGWLAIIGFRWLLNKPPKKM
jgi:hypothetical protein